MARRVELVSPTVARRFGKKRSEKMVEGEDESGERRDERVGERSSLPRRTRLAVLILFNLPLLCCFISLFLPLVPSAAGGT